MEPWKNTLISKVKFYIDKGDTELVSSIAQYFSIEIHVFGWLISTDHDLFQVLSLVQDLASLNMDLKSPKTILVKNSK